MNQNISVSVRQNNDFRFSVDNPTRIPSVLRAIGVRRLAESAAVALHLLYGSLAISSGGSGLGESFTAHSPVLNKSNSRRL